MKKIQGSHVPGGLQCFCLDVGFPRLRNKTPQKAHGCEIALSNQNKE